MYQALEGGDINTERLYYLVRIIKKKITHYKNNRYSFPTANHLKVYVVYLRFFKKKIWKYMTYAEYTLWEHH